MIVIFYRPITAWFANLTAQLKSELANMHKTTMNIIEERL